MSRALSRRGPDGDGEWRGAGGRVVLAHRRLAVLDPSPAAAQPMSTPDGRLTLAYNGEIYDFREHARELSRQGVELHTKSDTEVLLHLWRLRGADALSGIRGMFAFALWDERAGELVLARDSYGIKPLYYSWGDGILRFASQVRALVQDGAPDGEIDVAGLAGFLAWGAVPEPLTIRRGIRALPAGHLARLDADGRLRIEPWPRRRSAGAVSQPHAAVAESVAAHLVSDVPVALFLSAGMDSTIVAACAARRSDSPPTALTLTWEEARGTDRDEAPLATETAKRLGLPHVVRAVAAAEVRSALPEVVDAMDQPSIDGFNTWLVARLAREHGFKVALSGPGGGELCGGYRSFADLPRWVRRSRRLRRIPGADAMWRVATRPLLGRRPKMPEVFRYARSFAGAYALRRGLYLPHEIDRLLEPLVGQGRRPYDAVVDAWETLGSHVLGDTTGLLDDPWRVVHRLESSLYLRNQLLRDADWAGMAHGVEIRVPFVDMHLLSAFEAADFEPVRKRGKAQILAVLAPDLAPELVRRPKTGFQLPIEEWLAGRRGSRSGMAGRSSRKLAWRVLARLGLVPEKVAESLRKAIDRGASMEAHRPLTSSIGSEP